MKAFSTIRRARKHRFYSEITNLCQEQDDSKDDVMFMSIWGNQFVVDQITRV